MDFEASGKNPFLMDDSDYGNYGDPAAGSVSSNPFLSNVECDAPGLSENPFLSAMGGDVGAGAGADAATSFSTNPFAAFADPAPEPANGQPAMYAADGMAMYSTTPYQVQQPTAQDYYTQVPETVPIDPRNVPSSLELKDGTVPHPDTDYCMETSEIFSSGMGGPPSQPSSGRSTPRGGPRRPPPPRPVPPSQETKNLILSVTGAMEATSSHLLDRLPPTRTPSPTLLRDLESPIPDAPFSDFLGVGGGMAPDTSGYAEANLLGDLDDISQPVMMPHAEDPVQQPPIRPGVPPAPVSKAADIMDLFDSVPPAIIPSATSAFGAPLIGNADVKDIEPAIAAPAPEAATFAPVETTQAEKPPDVFAKTSPPPVPAPPVVPPAPKRPPPPAVVQPPPMPPAPVAASPVSVPPPPMAESELPPPILTSPVQPKAPSITHTPVITPVAEQPVMIPAKSPEEPDLFGTNQKPVAEAPKNTADIMNLFGSDRAAVIALNSAPVQAADDFFGGGGGFPADSQPAPPAPAVANEAPSAVDAEFDVFTAKFENAATSRLTSDPFDPFSGGSAGSGGGGFDSAGDAWGAGNEIQDGGGFGTEDSFDAFLSMSAPPVPQSTPARVSRAGSADSDEGPDFSVVIKPHTDFGSSGIDVSDGFVPVLAPPPIPTFTQDTSASRFNPFDKSGELNTAIQQEQARPEVHPPPGQTFPRSDSAETPPTPLFDEDTSYPLEDFPRIHYEGPGWEMQLRQPNRKKITGQRFWKKIFIRLVYQGENPVLQLLNTKDDKDPFQELPLQACYCISDISAQQFDQYGKIFTVKLQYVFYKERPGVRPGQVTKAERITNKLSQFAAYAIQGDYQGCKEFASDLKKLGMPVEHAPQISQLFKIGSQTYEDMKQFSIVVEEALFKLPAHRDRALNYKQEEVQITAVDELYVEQDKYGHVDRQIARVRLFFLGFLSGMPDIELGVNDMWRQGKEVVGRHDIIPVVTEEWIRLEGVEFHSCVQLDEYERTKTIKFKPPDACYIELMRFRVRPPRNRELPLQLKAVMCVTGRKVELRADVLVPGFSSRKYGQIPCEDISIRFPIPECWIYLFRVEKHFRYGSVKSAHRRAGKVKGIERFLGALETMDQSLMEVTSGQAKYEHQHRSIVWRVARLPKEGQGAYTTHTLVCRMNLTSYDQIPSELTKYAYVEFTMPQTQVSHMTVRSVSIQPQPDEPPEKYVRQLSRHEYRVEIEHTQGEGPGAYIAATIAKPSQPAPVPEERAAPAAESDSDSD